MITSGTLESPNERREKIVPFLQGHRINILPRSKDVLEEDEFPLGLAVGILSNSKQEDNKENPASYLKGKVEQFLEEANISGIVFNMSVPSSGAVDVKQIIIVSNIIIFSHIAENRRPDEISELQALREFRLGKKLAVVSTDQTENSCTKQLRDAVDFLIKYPFDSGEFTRMMWMFISSIKENCKGVFPMGREVLHD